MRAALALLTLCAVALAGCAGCDEADPDGLEGAVRVDGSSTVFPLAEAVAEEFMRDHPGVRVTVGASGTGGRVRQVRARRDRRLERQPRHRGRRDRVAPGRRASPFVELPVAYDGIAVVTHPESRWVGLPHDRRAKADLGARQPRRDLGRRPARLPRRARRAVRAGHEQRDLRLLHRRRHRRGGREPDRLHGVGGRQRARSKASRATRGRSPFSGWRTTRRTPTASSSSASTAGAGASGPRPRRSSRASTRRSPASSSSTSTPTGRARTRRSTG